jgi:hypothetical protein
VAVILLWTYGVIEAIEWAKEEGVRRAQYITARVAFAAPIAAAIVGASAKPELVALVTELSRLPLEEVKGVASSYLRLADVQLAQLEQNGTFDAHLKEWSTKYGMASDGTTDLSFNGVRERIVIALGGFEPEGPLNFEVSQL